MTYDRLVEMALELPDTEEATSYNAAAIKRKGRNMFALKADGETVAMKLDWETHDRLLEEHPEIFYITPHYEGWPWLLVRLPLLSEEMAREIMQVSWEDAPRPAKVRKGG